MFRHFVTLALLTSSLSVKAAPAEVLIIRHAEKPNASLVSGKDGRDLSPRGYERANALVNLFTTDPRLLEFGVPVAIYAGAPKKPDTGSLRPLETIQPIAKQLGLTPLSDFISDDFASMVSEVMTKSEYVGKTVLISWAHSQIPDMATEFGANKDEVPAWDGSVFDRVWKMKFDATGAVTDFENLPQHVLPGDSAN